MSPSKNVYRQIAWNRVLFLKKIKISDLDGIGGDCSQPKIVQASSGHYLQGEPVVVELWKR